jgi:hypothetical protein
VLPALLTAGCFFLAYAPASLILDDWRPFALVLPALVGLAAVFGAENTTGTRPPAPAVVASISAESAFAILATALWLLIYGATYGIATLVNRFTDAAWAAGTLASVAGVMGGGLLSAFAVYLITEDIANLLARRKEDVRSAYEQIAPGWRAGGVVAAAFQVAMIAVSVAVASFLDVGGRWVAALTLVVVSLAALVVYGTVTRSTRAGDGAADPILQSLAASLEKAGFEATTNPRIGDTEIDPLLDVVRLVAHRDNRSFVISLIRPTFEDSDRSAMTAPDLIIAAHALEEHARRHAEEPLLVEPLMVVIDAEPAEPLQRLARGRVMHVVTMTTDPTTGDLDAMAVRMGDLPPLSLGVHEPADGPCKPESTGS